MISEHKDLAKQQLVGNVGTLLGCTIAMNLILFVLGGIIGAISGIFSGFLMGIMPHPVLVFLVSITSQMFTNLITTMLSGCLTMGLMSIYLNLTRGTPADFSQLFSYTGDFVGCGLLVFFMTLFIQLWSMLCLIPGIIAAFSYSMAMYIYLDNPGINPLDALKQSKEMMRGHKMDLLMLNLSFILWHLLGMVTCGLAYIYVVPYIAVAQANFYNTLKDGGNGTTGGGYSPKPGGYQPGNGGFNRPQVGGGYTAPQVGGGHTAPQVGGYTAPQVGGQTAPQGGGYPPPQNGGYPPPPNGGYPPPQNGGYPPPQNGGYPPPQNGGYPPPQNGGYPPPQNGGYPPPQNGGYPPPQNGGYPPPQNGGFAPEEEEFTMVNDGPSQIPGSVPSGNATCGKCNFAVTPGVRFCENCGSPLE